MKNEFTNVNAISYTKPADQHIKLEHNHWYVCRPDKEHQGHFLAITKHANPADLRQIADMIEADRKEAERKKDMKSECL